MDSCDPAVWDDDAAVASLRALALTSPQTPAPGGAGAAPVPAHSASAPPSATPSAETDAGGVAPILLGDDALVRRFLRARRGDAALALDMLRQHSAWRRSVCGAWWPGGHVHLDKVRRQLATGKAFVHGTDMHGRPVAWIRVGRHFNDTPREEIESLVLFTIDEVCARCDALGVEQATIVCDFDNFGFSNNDTEAASFLMKTLSSNFPERLARMVFVRESVLFWAGWQVIKLFIDERTSRKIVFLGSSYRQGLLELFNDAQLPRWLGGTDDYEFAAEHATRDGRGGPNDYVHRFARQPQADPSAVLRVSERQRADD